MTKRLIAYGETEVAEQPTCAGHRLSIGDRSDGAAAFAPTRLLSRIALALVAGLVRVTDILLLWQARRQQRRMLGGLGDHTLKDIGLSRADVDGEIRKSSWHA